MNGGNHVASVRDFRTLMSRLAGLLTQLHAPGGAETAAASRSFPEARRLGDLYS
jgi:hypothetical protein